MKFYHESTKVRKHEKQELISSFFFFFLFELSCLFLILLAFLQELCTVCVLIGLPFSALSL